MAQSFSAIRNQLKSLDLSPLTDFGRGIWIYGAGGFGRTIAKALNAVQKPVLGFIDQKGGEGKHIDGLPCIRPDEFGPHDAQGACYAHGLHNHYFSSANVADWAQRQDFKSLLFPTDFNRIPGVVLSNYWLGSAKETLNHLDEIEFFYDELDDDESRILVERLLSYRLNADPRKQPAADLNRMYAPDFLPIRNRPLTFIDGGAYIGDSLEGLLNQGVIIDDWTAFEPDEGNLKQLRTAAIRLSPRFGSFSLMPYGLSDRNGLFGFSDSEGAASHLVENPGADFLGTKVAVTRLDDAIKRSGPVYIKLDIEGAERAALRGMERFLSEGATLAISVYHRPSDLWEIPGDLMRLGHWRHFRLRQHGYHGFDTVLYAYN